MIHGFFVGQPFATLIAAGKKTTLRTNNTSAVGRTAVIYASSEQTNHMASQRLTWLYEQDEIIEALRTQKRPLPTNKLVAIVQVKSAHDIEDLPARVEENLETYSDNSMGAVVLSLKLVKAIAFPWKINHKANLPGSGKAAGASYAFDASYVPEDIDKLTAERTQPNKPCPSGSDLFWQNMLVDRTDFHVCLQCGSIPQPEVGRVTRFNRDAWAGVVPNDVLELIAQDTKKKTIRRRAA